MLKLQSRRVSRCVIPTQLVLFALLAGPLPAADLALRISGETAPAGGWAQIKVFSQTPQLVASGRIVMTFDPAIFGTISSVAVFSAQGDAMGIAAVDGTSLDVSFSSPANGIGQLPHLPVLTVTIPILATAHAGTVSPITLDASQSLWTGPQYTSYSVTADPGSVTVAGTLSVQNLTPGGGLLPAGALVRIHGAGFSAATTATVDGVAISNTQFAGPGEIDLTLAGAADLTGKRVELRNPDGSLVEYFSSMPSVPDQSPAYVPSIQPLLSMQTWTSVAVTFTVRGGAIAIAFSMIFSAVVAVFAFTHGLAFVGLIAIVFGLANPFQYRALAEALFPEWAERQARRAAEQEELAARKVEYEDPPGPAWPQGDDQERWQRP